MRRVTRHACEDGPILEEQETEGQRQLQSLLLQQLDTDVDVERCVAKKQCFGPVAVYKPFGEQAVGVKSLSQFQALQDGEKELDSLRELGLTDAEIQLWQSREEPVNTEKAARGVRVSPAVRQQRLEAIRDKMAARNELLSRPQRFAASRPLSRREMEIEQALFQGSDRRGFLSALYHRDEDKQKRLQGASSDPMDCLYRDVLCDNRKRTAPQDTKEEGSIATHLPHPPAERGAQPSQISPQISSNLSQTSRKDTDQSHTSPKRKDQSQSSEKDIGRWQEHSHCQSETLGDRNRLPGKSELLNLDASDQGHPLARPEHLRLAAANRINVSQPIGRLCGAAVAGIGGPLTVRGEIEDIPDEDILTNRETEEGIRNIPRFRNYQRGEPSKVLCVKNLSAQASGARLVSLFSRFEPRDGPPILYRLLTGRLKGQAFVTLSDKDTAQKAVELLHGYRLLGKPLVIEFGRERTGATQLPKGEEEEVEGGKNKVKEKFLCDPRTKTPVSGTDKWMSNGAVIYTHHP